MTTSKIYPFYDGDGAVPYEFFEGRELLRDVFASMTWNRGLKRQEFVWVVEGPRGYGKSSFGKWCCEAAARQFPRGDVLVCYVDLATPIAVDKKISTEEFLRHLYDELLKKFRPLDKQRIRRKISRSICEIYEFLQSGEAFGFKLPEVHFNYRSWKPEKFFQQLQLLNDSAKIDIKAFILILDEISSRDGALALSCDLARALRLTRWPDNFPNVGLILLQMPGWEHAIPVPQRLRPGPAVHALKAFTLPETLDFVTRWCQDAKWTFNNITFIHQLFSMSGGIPYLLQRIGFAACQASQKRSPNSCMLTAEDVTQVVSQDEEVEIRVYDAISFSGFPLSKYVKSDDSAPDPQLLAAFCWAFSPPTILDRGLTKEDWKKNVHSKLSGSSQFAEAFERVWKELVDAQLIIPYDDAQGQYIFCAEAVRWYLGRFDPR